MNTHTQYVCNSPFCKHRMSWRWQHQRFTVHMGSSSKGTLGQFSNFTVVVGLVLWHLLVDICTSWVGGSKSQHSLVPFLRATLRCALKRVPLYSYFYNHNLCKILYLLNSQKLILNINCVNLGTKSSISLHFLMTLHISQISWYSTL